MFLHDFICVELPSETVCRHVTGDGASGLVTRLADGLGEAAATDTAIARSERHLPLAG